MPKIDHSPKHINAQIRHYYKKFLKESPYNKCCRMEQLDIKIGIKRFIVVNRHIIDAGKRPYQFFIDNGMWHWGGHTYKTQLQDGPPLLFPVSDYKIYQSAYLGNMRSQFRRM